MREPYADVAAVNDAFLPAAPFLTSPAAFDVLAPALAAAGERLVRCRAVQVHYRPGHELVVRYRTDSVRADGTTDQATVLAGTTAAGPPPGTLHVTAVGGGGVALDVGVWRWPFDPVLAGLATAVTPNRVAAFLGGVLTSPASLDVIVYRPTERAVVRVSDARGTSVFVKVVPPATTSGLVDRHTALGGAGLPVPRVVAADPVAGLVALSEVPGPTLRELVKQGVAGAWPEAGEFLAVRERLANTTVGTEGRPSRRIDALHHAAMLATVMPESAGQLADVTASWGGSTTRTGPIATIHGDLHEAQIMVAGGRISGLIDVDDVGPGDPLDDLATVLGHLTYRALTSADAAASIERYVARLRAGFVAADVSAEALDLSTAAVLIGLATGPFRVQMRGWEQATAAVLDAAARIAALGCR